ncbi:TadE family protein [Microbacterium sp. SSM24]|uniref:TadE family protein n=1 Tax=Microbacterium sp. SSM24 TaxID=2991714 RepID=UPI002227F949|nr:TadE family protein [Microbacterium sp. SSM24]MCW3494148.1 TadE family protein [Microbacterium sp. SSM24]
MHPWNRSTEISTGDPEAVCAGERGSAALEFIVVGLLMLVPILYLIAALASIQGQSLGAEAGARHIARAIVTADDVDHAEERAEAVLASIAEEYGLDRDEVAVSLTCRPASAGCPAAGATLTVTLRTAVTLPLVPPVLGLDRAARIPIEATAVQKVSRVWGLG